MEELNNNNHNDDDKWVLDSSLVHYNETFDVTVHRNSLGLGFSIIQGETGIRIKKIFPLQPAWETGKLRQGDILLKVSGVSLDSLSVREALDVLRSSPSSTVLSICRPYSQSSSNNNCSLINSVSSVTRSYSFTPVNTSSIWEGKPLIIPSPTTTSCDTNNGQHADEDLITGNNSSVGLLGEFTVILLKVKGSLGFTLKASEDNTVMRHSIKALVKEPALSNKQLKPGDKLISANKVDCSKFSHSELVQFLRHCPERVVLKLYRDASRSQTPVTSPDKPFFENNNNNIPPSQHPFKQSGKMLRYEAIEMVRSLQASRSSSLLQEPILSSSLNRRKIPKELSAKQQSSVLPLIESPETESKGETTFLPPVYFAQESMQRLQIQELSPDEEETTSLPPPITTTTSTTVRPDSLDLSKRRQKSYAFHSKN